MFKTFTQLQPTPALTWTINHNLNMGVVCDVINAAGAKILPYSIKHLTSNTLLVEFDSATAGEARVVGKYAATYPEGSVPGSVDAGAVARGPNSQLYMIIRNGFGALVGVNGHETSPSYPYAYAPFTDLQSAVTFPYVTNQVGFNNDHFVDTGAGVTSGNPEAPAFAMPVGETFVQSHVNTLIDEFLISQFWFVGVQATDSLWVTGATFGSAGDPFTVYVTVGPSAVIGAAYQIDGSAVGVIGTNQIFTVKRLTTLV